MKCRCGQAMSACMGRCKLQSGYVSFIKVEVSELETLLDLMPEGWSIRKTKIGLDLLSPAHLVLAQGPDLSALLRIVQSKLRAQWSRDKSLRDEKAKLEKRIQEIHAELSK